MPERTLVRSSWPHVVAVAVIAVMAVATHRGPFAYAPPWSQMMFSIVMGAGTITIGDAMAAERRGWKPRMLRAGAAAVAGAVFGFFMIN